jgi:hypothetical protein
VNINRRHKVGLFFVLVVAGLSLFWEASARQTEGIVLIGIAAAWAFGSVSLRALRIAVCCVICALGVYVAVQPIWSDRQSAQLAAQDYDLAVLQIRQAIARAVPITRDISAPVVDKYGDDKLAQKYAAQGVPPGLTEEPIKQPANKYGLEPTTPASAPAVEQSAPDTLPGDFFDKHRSAKAEAKHSERARARSGAVSMPQTQGETFTDVQPIPGLERDVSIPDVALRWVQTPLPDGLFPDLAEAETIGSFAEKVRAKYPEYSDMKDAELVGRIVLKYPALREYLRVDESARLPSDYDTAADETGAISSPSAPAPQTTDELFKKYDIGQSSATQTTPPPAAAVTLKFAGDVSDKDILRIVQTKYLQPKPSFSLTTALGSHRLAFFSGFLLVVFGLVGVGLPHLHVGTVKRAAPARIDVQDPVSTTVARESSREASKYAL